MTISGQAHPLQQSYTYAAYASWVASMPARQQQSTSRVARGALASALVVSLSLTGPLACSGRRAATELPAPADLWPAIDRPMGYLGGGEDDAAVIVGIDDYDMLPPIEGAYETAKAWKAHLIDVLGVPAENVKLLRERDSTKGTILDELGKKAKLAKAGGRVWFVFIGHGASTANGEDSLLLGVDTREAANSFEERGLRQSDVIDLLESSAAQPILILDTCFSGKSRDGSPLVPNLMQMQLAEIRRPARAAVLAAATREQYAGQLPGGSMPAFSYLVLGALRGWGNNGGNRRVTVDEVIRYAEKTIGMLVVDREQTPELVWGSGVMMGLAGTEEGPNLGNISRVLASLKDNKGTRLEKAEKLVKRATKIPENSDNRTARAELYESIADLYRRGLTAKSDPQELKRALGNLETYIKDFGATYPGETVSTKVTTARDDLRSKLGMPVQTEGAEVRGLTIGGGTLVGVAGVAFFGMFVGGYTRTSSIERQFDKQCYLTDPLSDSCQDLYDRGRLASGIATAGLIMAPLLLGSGVTLLVLSARRKALARHTLAPALSPGLLGWTWRYRF